MVRFALAAAVCMTAALIGCGGGSGDPRSEGTITGSIGSELTPAVTRPDHPAEGDEKAVEKEQPGGAEDEQAAKKVEDPGKGKRPARESEAAEEAIKRFERLQKQTSHPLTREDLERIADRAQAQTERLADPPPGKTVEDVLREIQEEATSGIP